tara:strand:+ start:55181 stop:55426 length:246 start_codon:yes stop_codon:yes gene_type:complete
MSFSILRGLVIAAMMLTLSPSAFAEEKFDLVSVCKKDCPKAKNNEEAHKCAEKIGRLNKEFRKSKCWEVNEQYEKTRESKE